MFLRSIISFIFVGSLFTCTSAVSLAEVHIADKYRLEIFNQYIEVKHGQYWQYPVSLDQNDLLEVSVNVYNKIYKDLSVFVCHQDDVQSFMANNPSGCRGINKGIQSYNFTFQAYRPGPHIIIVDNSYSMMMKKKASLSVYKTATISDQEKTEMKTSFDKFSQGISKVFQIKKLDFNFKSCGQKNAFSANQGGAITLCSELYFDILKRQIPGALDSIIFHELGHSLLNIWGMPNWDNEETVDEFALVMLYWGSAQEKALDWIRYFEADNSAAQARYKLTNDDGHPLSVQRIRNIQRILRNPAPVIARWNKFLYPHMSNKALISIIDNPGRYEDKQLAANIHNQRNE